VKDFDVFVSYSRSDAKVVAQFTDALRRAGLRVWMDDAIRFGDEWRASIAHALGRTRLLLLVHSTRAEQSAEVAKEVAVAASLKLPIVPVRIEDAVPRGALLYEMARLSWVDCFPATEARMEAIALALVDMLKAGADPAASRRFAEALNARHFGAGLLRRVTGNAFAMAVGVLLTSALLMVIYDRSTGFLAQQADAGVSTLHSLWLLFAAATLGSPLLLVGALGRLGRTGAPLLAILAALNLLLMLLLARSLVNRAWLRWSIRRAARRAPVPS
jgi:TIR domain